MVSVAVNAHVGVGVDLKSFSNHSSRYSCPNWSKNLAKCPLNVFALFLKHFY